jgi:phospholipid/cholesterol/gamma-HCH transport system substrate-binding protein
MKLDPSVQMPADPIVLLNESSLFGEWQATIVERSALPHDETVRQQIADASHERGVIPGATLPGIGKLTAVAGQIAGDVANVAGRVEVAFDDQAACGRTPPISIPWRINCARRSRHSTERP